ncbi:MAG: restriction endonuclease subunit S [Deltaproteobacteria bacterium]|nr:restriction endonuclease subunit S [Deltaproteobacteria bacterium]
MIDASPQDLTTVKRILAKHLPECEVRAFGSRVSWTAKPYSDLDLVVLGPKKLSRKVLILIKSAFEESAIPITVDVLDWHRISPEFRENIEKEYETIQTPDERNAIPEGWRFRKVSEIAEVVGGGTPKTKKPEYWGGDIPWLTPKDLSGEHFRYVSRGERNITKAGIENSSARLVPLGTVLLTSRAPVGYVAMAKNPIATNQGFRSLVVNEEHDPDFIYYLLLHNTDYLKQHASGSTFQELSGSTLKSLEFLIPPLSEQRAIAHILGSLDDKIELNRRMNKTLEAMARAIFKSWFVDFDPVRTKAEGRDPGLPDEIAALFPDSFEDSELGEIPKGWEPSTIGSEFNLTMGQSPPGKTYNETGDGLPFFQGRRDFGFRFPTNRVYCTAPKRLADHGDTLVSVRAPVGDINMAMARCCVGRGVAGIHHKSGSRSYTYYAMHTLSDRFARFEAEGTVFGAINKKQFEGLHWLSPPGDLVNEFEKIAFPLDERIEKNTNETVTLSSLRDSLLPKLISGELRVPEAEKLAEVAI